MSANVAALLYLVAGVLFILALRGFRARPSSRQGNMFGMIGMAIAILTTLATRRTRLLDLDAHHRSASASAASSAPRRRAKFR